MMNIYPNDVVKIAEAELGYREKASNKSLDDFEANPGSANYTKYARDLHKANYYNGSKQGYEWCDVFVDWCFFIACGRDKAKAEQLECQTGKLGAGTKYSMQYYDAQGRFDKSPKLGDQIFFRYSGSTGVDHTGIVVEVTERYVCTVEGNSNDTVRRRLYPKSYSAILGYGHPKYDEEIGEKTEEAREVEKTVNIELPVLRSGDTGAEVRTLQRLLHIMGYKDASRKELLIDGEFGSNTKFAVIAYQLNKGGKGDGIVGEWTWRKLLRG